MEDLPESTYITFISDPYISSTVTPAIFNFKYISTYNKLKIKGFTFNKATSLKGSYV
jgi:predicted small secreted protein